MKTKKVALHHRLDGVLLFLQFRGNLSKTKYNQKGHNRTTF